MEPLEPEFREALKREHPGLEDRDIDRYEELLAQRFLIEPEKAPQRIRELDREREQLLQERMPRYHEAWQRYNAKGPRGHSRPMG